MKKIIAVLVVAAVIAGGAAFWYFVIRDEELNVSTKNIDSSQTSKDIKEQATPDGTWVVSQQGDVFAGYEIQELFGGESIEKTAVGKSKEVDGSFVLNETLLSGGTFSVDMTQLKSNESQRDGRMEDEGLETNDFPDATFEQSGPVTISSAIVKNQDIAITVPGILTLHGEEKEVTIQLIANWDGKVIKVSGELAITLAEYAIEPPDSSFVSVDDNGILKLQLLFVPKSK